MAWTASNKDEVPTYLPYNERVPKYGTWLCVMHLAQIDASHPNSGINVEKTKAEVGDNKEEEEEEEKEVKLVLRLQPSN